MSPLALAGPQTRRSKYGEVIALRSATGENDFAGFAFSDTRDSIPRRIQSRPGLLPNVMNARRISKNAVQVRKHCRAHFWIKRRGRVVIEINRAHARIMPQN